MLLGYLILHGQWPMSGSRNLDEDELYGQDICRHDLPPIL